MGIQFRSRLIIGALAPLVVAGAIQAGYSVISQRRAATEGLDAKARAVANLMVDVAGPSIALDDPKAVDDSLVYAERDSDFALALAVGRDGKPIAFRGRADELAVELAAVRVTPQPTTARRGETLVASYPVITEGKQIGEIVVGMRTARAEAEAGARTTRAALIALVGIALAVLVVLGLAGRIARRNREMTALLDNMDQGFLSVHPDGTLAAERSAMAARLIGAFEPGQVLWAAFARVDARFAMWLEFGWGQLREGVMPVELLIDQLPKRMTSAGRIYRIDYKVTFAGDALAGDILVVITDATAEVERERAEAAERDLLGLIERMTRDRAQFREFVEELDRLFAQVTAAAGTPASEALKRDIHTLKGNCGVFGVHHLAGLWHAVEDRIADHGVIETEAVDQAARAWNELKRKLESVLGSDLASSSQTVSAEDLVELHAAIADGRSLAEIQHLVRTWQHERTRRRLEHFAEQARTVAIRLGKPDVEIAIADHDVRLDPGTFRSFWSVFTHVVRNAVDHGIEPASDRVAVGKPDRGRIELETVRVGGEVVIAIRDDGRGIDWERVRVKAREAGRPHASRDDLIAALFSDGVTTRDVASETSGRGLGLAAIRERCVALGGAIEVDSELGKGARFVFRFPSEAAPRIVDTAA